CPLLDVRLEGERPHLPEAERDILDNAAGARARRRGDRDVPDERREVLIARDDPDRPGRLALQRQEVGLHLGEGLAETLHEVPREAALVAPDAGHDSDSAGPADRRVHARVVLRAPLACVVAPEGDVDPAPAVYKPQALYARRVGEHRIVL